MEKQNKLKYRVVHFATHGALSGQLDGSSEPGLLLSPPDNATETDRRWISLSVRDSRAEARCRLGDSFGLQYRCRWAGGGRGTVTPGARAFFYAGARALLVSHWAVYSHTTVKLIIGAVSRMAANRTVGRANAMRQSMLALIETGKPQEAYPEYWAPFVVVGEGAAR
jgi:CHAT domain-containing protein